MAMTVVQKPTSSLITNGLVTWTVTINDAGYKFLRFSMGDDVVNGGNVFANNFWFSSSTAAQKDIPGQSGNRIWYYKVKKGKTYTFTYKAVSVGSKTINISQEKIDNKGNVTRQTSIQTLVVSGDPSQVTPAAPSGLAATALSARRISLTWVDNSTNETGFNVFRANSSAGPFTDLISTVGAGTTAYIDEDLQGSSTYYYQVCAVNAAGSSANSATASATTTALPAVPAAPSVLTATSVDQGRIDLAWTDNSSTEDGFRIYSAAQTGGPYTLIDEVGVGEVSYSDTGLASNVTFYYVVRSFNEGGESDNSNEASATTATIPQSMGTVSPFYMDPRSRISSVQAGDSLQIYSDWCRAHVLADGYWSRAGMKPQLTAPVISDGGSPTTKGYTGTYTAQICVKFGDRKRSLPGPVSNSLTITNRQITIVPPNDGSRVTVRDEFYDMDANRVYGALTWEIYLYEQNLERPVRIIELPITTLTYTTGENEGIDGLDQQVKRPMETGRESQIGPCCAYGIFDGVRVHTWGELTFKLTDQQIALGASLTIDNGERTATLVGADFNEALFMKELLIDDKATGWFVGDVEGNTIYLFSQSPEKNTAGWQLNPSGTPVAYVNFSFAPISNRMSRSAFFSGEAGGVATTYLQSFPPLNDIGPQLFADDRQNPVAAITARGAIFVFKRGKCLFVEGGFGLDESEDGSDKPTVQLIADNTGVLAPDSVVVDGDGNVICLSDSGPTMVSRGGIRRLGIMNGTAFMLKEYFDVASSSLAKASWFSREDYYICGGLNKIGNTGNRDGFIWESRTDRIVTFSLPRRICSLLQCLHNDGDFQQLFGDESGNVCTFLQKGIYTDNVNYQEDDPFATEEGSACELVTGVYSSGGNLTTGRYKLSVKQRPLTTAVSIRVGIDAEPQTSNPNTFTETVGIAYSTSDSRPFYRIDKWRTQAARFKVSFTSSRLELVQLRELSIEVAGSQSGQDQND